MYKMENPDAKEKNDNSSKKPIKKWGSRVIDGNEEKLALGIEALVGGALIYIGLTSPLKNFREALYNARHAAKTVSDAVKGGPEGMRAVKNLDEAIRILEAAKSENKEASDALTSYYAARKDFVSNLSKVYNENENLSRVCSRLEIQLKGTLKNFFETGNELKPEWWKENIDGPIIVTYGKALRTFGSKDYKDLTNDQIIAKALESSEKLKKFYEEARKFYDAREKNERTVREFCDYVSKVKETTEQENKEIESLFPQLISRVKEGYTVEDYLFEVDAKGTKMINEEVINIEAKVQAYDGEVTETRTEVAKVVPVEKYNSTTWVDVATNPFVVGAGLVLLLKGLSRAFLPRIADNAVSKAVCYPVKLTGNLANNIYNKIKPKKDGEK